MKIGDQVISKYDKTGTVLVVKGRLPEGHIRAKHPTGFVMTYNEHELIVIGNKQESSFKPGDIVKQVKPKIDYLKDGLTVTEVKGSVITVRDRRGETFKFHSDYLVLDTGLPPVPEKFIKPNNPYWDNIQAIADAQRAKGIRTYGQGQEDNTELDIEATLTYLQEELIDALMYVEHVKAKLKEANNDTK